MRTKDYFRMVSRNLRMRKGRVALTANGVLIGTAAVVLLVSLGVGMRNGVLAQFESIEDLRSIQVSPVIYIEGQSRGNTQAQEKIVQPLKEDVLAQIRSLSGVVAVIPQMLPAGYVECTLDQWTSTATLIGMGTRDLNEIGFTALEGTTRLNRGTVLLSQGTLDSFGKMIEYSGGGRIEYVHLETKDLLGKKLHFVIHKSNGEQTKIVEMKVVGIVTGEATGRNIYLSTEDVTVWNTFAMGRPMRIDKEGYSQASVRVVSIDQIEALAKQIKSLGFNTVTNGLVERVKQTYTLISILLGITGLISLAMAGLGIANTMQAATLEQTNEIGLWKALGASNRNVLGLILGQAVGIGLLGGLAGVLFGWLGSKLFNLLGGLNVSVKVWDQPSSQIMLAVTPYWLLFVAPLFAILVGLFSGLSPAMHAAALPAIEALKEE